MAICLGCSIRKTAPPITSSTNRERATPKNGTRFFIRRVRLGICRFIQNRQYCAFSSISFPQNRHGFIKIPLFPPKYTACSCWSQAPVFPVKQRKKKSLQKAGSQPVEKPAPAIKPEQFFCLETKAETEKASKQQLHFSPILFVFRHPAPDGGHSISKWPVFSDSWQQI